MNTKIVGILNITPDSFSDGGKFASLDGALHQLQKLLTEGADMIDIGAESTRPGHTPIDEKEEWRRLENILPSVIQNVQKFNMQTGKSVTTSIDTRHVETAAKAHALGIDIINDVDGLVDERMVDLIAEKNITTILMHNLPIPAVKGVVFNKHTHVNIDIIKWAIHKIAALKKRGVKKSQLIFDVGIGFGKDSAQAIRILKSIADYRVLQLPIYVGHSKKRFLDTIDFSAYHGPDETLDKSQKSVIISKYLIAKNVDFIRVHDVKETLS